MSVIDTITVEPVTAESQRATLIALLGEEAGLAAFKRLHPEPEPVEVTPLDALLAAGFTPEEAAKALEVDAPAEAEPTPPTAAELAEALVEASEYGFAKGRLYINAAIIRAMGEVMQTGNALIVAGEREGRAVLIYKAEGADVASVTVQNLIAKKGA